jgi:hypothetical protein
MEQLGMELVYSALPWYVGMCVSECLLHKVRGCDHSSGNHSKIKCRAVDLRLPIQDFGQSLEIFWVVTAEVVAATVMQWIEVMDINYFAIRTIAPAAKTILQMSVVKAANPCLGCSLGWLVTDGTLKV